MTKQSRIYQLEMSFETIITLEPVAQGVYSQTNDNHLMGTPLSYNYCNCDMKQCNLNCVDWYYIDNVTGSKYRFAQGQKVYVSAKAKAQSDLYGQIYICHNDGDGTKNPVWVYGKDLTKKKPTKLTITVPIQFKEGDTVKIEQSSTEYHALKVGSIGTVTHVYGENSVEVFGIHRTHGGTVSQTIYKRHLTKVS